MIGVFDSGVGGLTVWRELYALMPQESYTYLSDGAFCPYGNKPPEQIVKRASAITEFLLSKGAEIIVVACNTATAAAISYLRSHYNVPFVGMEPAVKPAALQSRTGIVGVLATAGTLKGELYHRTLARFASDVNIIERVGEGLVELVESGKLEGAEVEEVIRPYILDMVMNGADHIVLGCTHYPFLEPVIRRIAGKKVTVVNPAPAVARQVQRILAANRVSLAVNSDSAAFYSTAGTDTLEKLLRLKNPDLPAVFETVEI